MPCSLTNTLVCMHPYASVSMREIKRYLADMSPPCQACMACMSDELQKQRKALALEHIIGLFDSS